jgi:hypothetical protein
LLQKPRALKALNILLDNGILDKFLARGSLLHGRSHVTGSQRIKYLFICLAKIYALRHVRIMATEI